MQIRTKLTLWFIAISALLLLLSLIFIYVNFRNHLKSEYYKNLQSKALMAVAMLEKNNASLSKQEGSSDSKNAILPAKENIIVYNLSFEKLFSFNEEKGITKNILTHIKEHGEYKFNLGNYNAIGLRFKTNAGKELLIIAKGMFISDELLRLTNILVITFFLFLFFIALAGYYYGGKVLQPLTKTMNELDQILPANLSNRLHEGPNKDEITRLTGTFNKLLDRIEDAFNIQKGFLSNISHELRNPLASIISSIQVILSRERSIREYQQCLESVLHDASDLEHISTHLMELARLSSKSDKILFGLVRIDEVIWQSKAWVRKNNPEYNFKFDTSSFPEDAKKFEIQANDALLKTAFVNLLENACKFSPDHIGFVKLYISANDQIAVEIKDTASIIQKDELEQIFKPFYRSNITSKIKGSGIGLSLVASILNIHNAKLTITNNSEGNIFTVYFN